MFQLRAAVHLALGQLKDAEEACEPYAEAAGRGNGDAPWRLWVRAQIK